MKKKILSLGVIAILAIMLFALTGCGDEETNTSKNAQGTTTTSATNKEITSVENKENDIKKEEDSMYSSGIHHATIEVRDYGTIKLELDADTAPITVANFAKLVNEGFYDGLTFHRIIEGFMMQGGDPLGNGTGGSDETIKGEFSENGVRNDISHERGTLSMARSADPDSGSSQFFIVHQDSTYLDGQYAGFGKVLEGMEVVDKICSEVPVKDDNGTVDVEYQPVIVSIKMIEK